MALVLRTIITGCKKLGDLQDPRVSDHVLLTSTFLISLIGCYSYFVTNWGPKFMKNRKPYNLQNLLRAYNSLQIVLNTVLFVLCVEIGTRKRMFCLRANFSQDPDDVWILTLGLFYYYIKLIDLLDTIFFILRKHFRQASFLHVYHHIGVVLMAWIGCKWQVGGHSYFIGPINTFVHIVMYSYYFFTSIDSCREWALGWKKFVTQIQLVQHFLLFGLFLYPLLDSSCQYEKFFCYMMVPQCTLMILLFGEFYIKTYILKKNKKKSVHE